MPFKAFFVFEDNEFNAFKTFQDVQIATALSFSFLTVFEEDVQHILYSLPNTASCLPTSGDGRSG